jgi:hypothetical protein
MRGRSLAINRLWQNRLVSKASLLESNPNKPLRQPIPITKRMHNSYVEEFLPFKSDSHVQQDYVNVFGFIRFGKILEDLVGFLLLYSVRTRLLGVLRMVIVTMAVMIQRLSQ